MGSNKTCAVKFFQFETLVVVPLAPLTVENPKQNVNVTDETRRRRAALEIRKRKENTENKFNLSCYFCARESRVLSECQNK